MGPGVLAVNMRILIDPGSYHCANVGVAMLQVATERLRNLWPRASLDVLTEDPEGIATLCPGVNPVGTRGHQMWFADRLLLGRAHSWLPGSVARPWNRWVGRLRLRAPGVYGSLLRMRFRRCSEVGRGLEEFRRTSGECDLIVISGLGGMRSTELRALDTLSLGIARRIPTAMFGLGIAPGQPTWVHSKGAGILPFVDQIAVREGRTAPAFLASVGVPVGRVTVTGDDAVGLAFRSRIREPGRGLGVNLRIQPSSEVDRAVVPLFRTVINEAVGMWGAPLVALPGAVDVPDAEVIQEIVGDSREVPRPGNGRIRPMDLVMAAGGCRLVITGAYHIAVFALSQGVPCVCVARSAYFTDKFVGLSAQFGEGCEVVPLDGPDVLSRLRESVKRLWEAAPSLRASLLESAQRQDERSERAYGRLKEIVEARATRHRNGN